MSIRSYLKILREEASASLWSEAAALARRNVFHVTRQNSSDFQVRVQDSGQGLNPSLELFVDDEDWVCDCLSKQDPCIHVLAATIAIKRNQDHGLDLPSLTLESKVIKYAWVEREQLQLQRSMVTCDADGREIESAPFTGSLVNLVSGLKTRSDFLPDKHDLKIDHLIDVMKTSGHGYSRRLQLLTLLRKLDTERFYGDFLANSEDLKPFIGQVIRESGGLRVRIQARFDQAFKNGFATSNGNVLALPDQGTLQDLAAYGGKGIFLSGRNADDFLASVLPKLEKFTDFSVKSVQQAEYQKAHIRLSGQEQINHLIITPRIFYGQHDPVAFVKNDQIQMIDRDSPPPLRDRTAERRLRDDLWQNHRLNLNEPIKIESARDFRELNNSKLFAMKTYGFDLQRFKLIGRLEIDRSLLQTEDRVIFRCAERKGFEAELSEVMEHFARGESLMSIEDLGVVELPTEYLRAKQHLLLDLLRPKGQSSLGDLQHRFAKSALTGEAGWAEEAVIKWLQPLYESDLEASLAKITCELRPYQRDGVQWLLALRDRTCGALLADDMGLGKTIQAITCIKGQTLILCPATLLENWRREIAKFRPELKVTVYHGSQRSFPTPLQGEHVLITSYGILRQEQTNFASRRWDVAVMDESQTFRNPDSQIFSAVAKLSAEWRLALSGTPIENRIDDLWAQMEILNPGYLGSRQAFVKSYDSRHSESITDCGPYLRRKIAPFIKRRMKSEVAKDLPPKTEYLRVLTMSENERSLYDLYLASVRQQIQSDENLSVPDILTVLLRLRQICCHPNLVNSCADGSEASKHKYLFHRVGDLIGLGHKVLIISQWTKHLDLIAQTLSPIDGNKITRIDGATRDRQQQVDMFQSDPKTRVMLMSLKAGGVGLNLTAADYVFTMDPWWNPAAEAQAHDRVYRIGQDKPVFVEKIIMRNTIEEGIIRLQERKRNLNFDLIDGLAGGEINLSRAEFLELLEDA